eukprot:2450082-Prymnesium_polylepis.1
MHVGDGWLVSSLPYRARANGLCRGASLVTFAERRISQAEEASPADSGSTQLRPYVRITFVRFSKVCHSAFQQPWLETVGMQHHVSVGWLLRATGEDSVTMLTTSRGLGTP